MHKESSDRRRPHEPLPYAAAAELRGHDLKMAAANWLAELLKEEEPPNAEQESILRHVIDQVLAEEADLACETSEPLIELVHGEPGTGKSKVLKWIVRFFTEVMG